MPCCLSSTQGCRKRESGIVEASLWDVHGNQQRQGKGGTKVDQEGMLGEEMEAEPMKQNCSTVSTSCSIPLTSQDPEGSSWYL